MLKTLFFDLGNVLVFFSRQKMYQQMAQCTGLTPDIIRNILVDRKIQELYELGQIDSAGFYQTFQASSPRSFSLHDLLEATSDIFTPNSSLFPLVEQLKEKGLRLVLLSNTSESHFNRVWAHYSVLRLFDDCVLSYEVGALKPSPLIFLKALAKAHCEPKYCFYTDDIAEFVACARKAGLDSELFTGVSDLKTALATRGLLLE